MARGRHAKYVQANSGNGSWDDRDDRFLDDSEDDWVPRGRHAKHAARPNPAPAVNERDDDWVPRGRHARHARPAVSESIPQHQVMREFERPVQQPTFEPELEQPVQQPVPEFVPEQFVQQPITEPEPEQPTFEPELEQPAQQFVSEPEPEQPAPEPESEQPAPEPEPVVDGDVQSTSELPVSRKRFVDSAVQGQVMPDTAVLNLDFLRQVSRSMVDVNADDVSAGVAVPFYVVPGQAQGVVPSGAAPDVVPGAVPVQDPSQAQGFVATDAANTAFVPTEQPQKVNNWQLSRSMWPKEEETEADEQQGWAEVPQSRFKAFKLRREQEQAQTQEQEQAQEQALPQDVPGQQVPPQAAPGQHVAYFDQQAPAHQSPPANGGFGSHARIPQEDNTPQAWSPQAHASHARASHARPEYDGRPRHGQANAAREFTIESPQHDYSKIIAIAFSVLMAAIIVSFSFFGAGHMKLPSGSTVTVKYDSRGGNSAHFSSGAMTTEVVRVGDTYGSGSFEDGDVHNAMPTTERNGYMFIGWYTEPSGGERVAASTEVTTTEDHTLYAHWR